MKQPPANLEASTDARPLDFDARQGAGEERTEPYLEYGEGAPEPATPHGAKRGGRVLGSAQKLVDSLQGVSIHAGFPNPAAESPLENPDFNKLLIRHPAATYCMRIAGHNWEAKGIFDGDIVVIDRATSAGPLDLVICWRNEDFVICQLRQTKREVWGVVSAVIHQYKNG